ncbi:hypothetical protein LEMA_P059600.1 [Plenodomus lingam JN3]|uniref:HAUS augmin-like complex subunit 6 N-terminal domain-containing protein n=1 Tax=Leptosphaeria maculans (strain JN3 / isolate v23.1.3 / race Av1-4-5-6-7-8) TaxID=985895 RepID=E4ZHU3_LEPMJ|nr:hypothetical protein LEMA_P059600.1 [Plenodomus lingam JN3]CBX90926.1 hypothetical protein LEMA_P059600.1 [Plenodomus lingam JN3]
MSRATSASSTSTTTTTTTTTTNGNPRSMAVKTTARAPLAPAYSPTDITLFVTNLRLLDLDKRDDWPDITVQTFSAKNADQKQRISGAEWALYRLFEIWDVDETAQKLQPFFPPLEPLQSLNLRAALYRCLNELKKNGLLGRETVLRKTMLDECKGDKFYEILAFFSTMVLKKVLAAQGDYDGNVAVARTLATAPSLTPAQQQSLLPLAIAHKAALVNVLKQKEEKRQKFKEFENLLNTKSVTISKRLRKCIETPRAKKPVISQKQAEAVKKELKDNWIGNPRWLDVMLHGDDVAAEDVFLTSRFDKVWHMVEKGYKVENVTTETGLLENLQSRVQEQESRLQKWKAFHKELKEEQSRSKANLTTAPISAKEFQFHDHIRLQLPSAKQNSEEKYVRKPTLSQEYQEILSDLEKELANVSTSKPIRPTLTLSRKHTSSISISPTPVLSRKNTYQKLASKHEGDAVTASKPSLLLRTQSFEDAPVIDRPRQAASAVTPADSEATYVGFASTVPSAIPTPLHAVEPMEMHYALKDHAETTPPILEPMANDSHPPLPTEELPTKEGHIPSPSASPHYPSEPPIPTLSFSEEIDPEEALADQIINSIGAATPSPVKKHQPRMSLSLIERTRLTMSRNNSFDPLPESPDPVSMAPPALPLPTPLQTANSSHQASLLERTRLTMEAMQAQPRRQSLAPQQASNKEKEKDKRKSRTSLFPVNQFDTPRTRKSIEQIERERSRERTPTEVLFSDKVDYDRVFKSRPKIATSPVFSPAVVAGIGLHDGEFEVDGVTGIDLGDVDIEGESGDEGKTLEQRSFPFTPVYSSSPLTPPQTSHPQPTPPTPIRAEHSHKDGKSPIAGGMVLGGARTINALQLW